MSKARLLHLSALFVLVASGLFFGAPRLWSAPEDAALDAVWTRVAQSGAYRFSADISQTSTPPANVVNAGRSSHATTLHMEGAADLPDESLQLTIWTSGGSVLDPASGIEVQVNGDTAMARQANEKWAEIEGFTGLFAPGGDLMAYSQAADNVVAHGTRLRQTPWGQVAVTRYTFDVDGRQLAIKLRSQLMEQAVRDGLPASVHADLTKAYADMTGTGELWVGADGLPLRQTFDLSFPPDAHDYATSAVITADFFDFAPVPTLTLSYRAGRTVLSGWQSVTGPQALASWAMIGVGVLFVMLVIARRRNRYVYVAVVATMIASTLAVPLLNNRQVYAYSVRQAEKESRATEQRADADAHSAQLAALAEPRMNPNRAPLAVAQERATATDDASRYYDDRCESDPSGDVDGDTLTNLEECLLGTLLDVTDSDADGVSDSYEVTGVAYNGTTWYSDPLNVDSNHDGIADGKEWNTDADGDGEPELDADGDGTPDVWDNDNDGDGVIDKLDMSPHISTGATSPTAKTFTNAEPLALTLDQLIEGELVKVEFQLRPENLDHLWYSQNVLNWPDGDQQGNIQDADGKTFYDIDNTTSPSPNANGDVRMVPLLEITFEDAYANLPPAASCTDDDGNSYTCYPLLEDFGISVTILDDDTSVAYVPLQLVADATGDANVAFYGRMMYQASGSWGTPHQVRMVWAVQALNDVCAEYANNICTSYSAYNDIQVVHTYYDDWHLTGLHLTEEHAADMALVYEDPVETLKVQPGYDSPFYVDVQFGLLYGLDKTLMAGRCAPLDADGACAAGATRDFTVADVYTRFNHTMNSGVSTEDRWNLPNVLGVVRNEYEAIDLGLLDTTITQTVKILDDHFTSAWTAATPITPTIMSVYEQQYRDLNLDQSITGSSHIAWNGNGLTLGLPQSGSDAVGVDTMVSLKWTPYAYDPATGWTAADIQQYWNSLDSEWGSSFIDPQDPDQADTYQTLAQHQYMSVYSGANTVVEMNDIVLPAPYQAPDEAVAAEMGVNATSYTLKAMKAYYGVNEDLAVVAAYLRSVGLNNNVALFAVGTYIEQKVIELYNKLGKVGFTVAVTALAIVALVVAVTYFVSLSVHNTGVRWTFAISVGILLFALTVLKPAFGYLTLLDNLVRTGDEVISYGTAIFRSLTELSTISEGAKVFGILGLLLVIGLAIGFFIAAWANGSAKPGSIAFNEGLAFTIAQIFVAVLLFAIGLLVLGGVFVALLSLIDTVLSLAGVKWTITGWFVKAIAGGIYSYDIYTTQSQQTGALDNTLVDPSAGLTAGALISFTLPITTTLTPTGTLNSTEARFRTNSLVYSLSAQPDVMSTATGDRYNDWITTSDNAWVTDYPTTQVPLPPGVNARVPLQLNAGWALGARSCWFGFCKDAPIVGNSSTALDDGLIFDVLPQTIDEFVNIDGTGWSSGRLAAIDADGDGLLSQRAGGLDPDDSTWDVDGDGLSDSYELTMRSLPGDQGGQNLDPLSADTDNDTISDSLELFWGTDPANQDSDDDGIVDVEELPPFGGWQLPYAPDKSTRIWSDPLNPDGDGDGLSDLFERTQVTCPTCQPWADPANPAVFSPNVWNLSPVALYVDDTSVNGYVRPGATVVYTSTTVNNLSGGQVLTGKLSVDAPTGFSATNTEATVDVNSGQTESLVTVLTVDATTFMTGAMASTMQLTDFASTVWSWDSPRTSSATAANTTRELDAATLTGWSDPVLMVAHETAADGSESVVAHVTSVSGVIRQSLPLTITASAKDGLTGPDIACTDDGDCLVVWGETDADQTGSLWISLLSHELPFSAPTRKLWRAAATSMTAPTVATSNGDFMVTWATQAGGQSILWSLPLDGVGDFKLSNDSLQQPIQPTAFRTTSAAGVSSPQSLWDGNGYRVVWAEGGSIWRAALDATNGASGAPTALHAGQGWPRSTGLAGSPNAVLDPVSLQSLLLYGGTDNHLYSGRLNAAGAFTPLALDTSNDFSATGVQTALCADPKNGGWVAAWALPSAGTVNYQAIGSDGTLRGERQTLSQSATDGLALACSTARPVVDLDFEEAEGTTKFADASGFGHDATCASGTCPLAGVQGRFGRAVRFNGASKEYLSVPNDADFNFAANEDFTVSFWVIADATQQDTTSPSVSIVEKWGDNAGGFPFAVRYLHATGRITAARYDGANNPSVQSAQAIDDGQFHHVVFTKNGATLALYIDGVQSGTVQDTTTGDTTNAVPLYIGALGGTRDFFTGTVDRFQTFPRALSLQEIGGIFDAASAIYDLDEPAGSQTFVDGSGNELIGTCIGDTCPVMGEAGVAYAAATFDGVDDVITVAPIKRVVTSYTYDFESGVAQQWGTAVPDSVLELKFDEPAGATVFADSSGGGHSAVCSGAACPQAGVAGRISQAVQFSGQSQFLNTQAGDYVEMGRGDFTIAAWVKTTATNVVIMSKQNNNSSWEEGERTFYLDSEGRPRFNGNGNGSICGNTPVNDGQWHHVAVTWDYSGSGTSGVGNMYVDGQLGNLGACTYPANNTDRAGTTVQIGRETGYPSTGYFSGAVDEVRIFDQNLTAAQIAQLAGTTPPRESLADYFDYSTVGLGAYYLGQFANETAHLSLTDLPPHDTVKVRFNLLPWAFTSGSPYSWGWDGNVTDDERGPDRWEWGYDTTAVLNTSLAQSFTSDKSQPQYWGFTQAYPSPYSVQAARPGLTIFAAANQQNYYFEQDTPNLGQTPVGDNPALAYPEELVYTVVRAYDNPNYSGQNLIWDPWAGDASWDQRWPSWVSSMRIWPSQYLPGTGATGRVTDGFESQADIYTVQGTLSDHTADSIDLYFAGQSSEADPGGIEMWGLDNVQVTLERDETSIPLNNQSFTLAAWAKRNATGNWDPIITQGQNGTDQHLYFGFRGDTPNLFTCAFSKVGDALNSPNAYTDLDWHHWVCTYDMTTNDRVLYRDGIEIARDTAAGSHSGLGATYIGRNVTTETFHGQIDEIGFWQQPFSAADVLELYNKVKAEDQSVMVGTLFAADDTAALAGSEVVLRETATNVGAIQQTTARTLTVDADNPAVCPDTSLCPLDDQYVQNSGTLIVAGTAEDPTSYIDRVEVDNSGWQALTGTAAWSYAWDISNLPDGEQTLPVRAFDAVGHVSPVYPINVLVDGTPPQLAFATDTASAQRPNQDAQGRWRVTLGGAVSDPNAGSKPGSGVAKVEVLLTGSGAAAGAGWQPAMLNDSNWAIDYVLPSFDNNGSSQIDPTGVFTVSVRAVDAIGNLTQADAYLTRQLRLDTDGPAVTMTAPVSDTQLITAALTFVGGISDMSAIAAVEVNLTPAEQMDALDGVVLHLPFDERRPTQFFTDESGANHSATCEAACPVVNEPGQRDRAAGFDGASQYLALPRLFDPATTNLTVAAWFNVDALGVNRPIVQQRDATEVGRAWLYVAADGTVQTYLGGSELATSSKVTTGAWHHAAVAYDGVNLRLYLDGVLETQAARTLEPGDGAMLVGAGKNLDYFFSGQLDELMTYNRALADYEVANLYAYGQGVWEAASLASESWSYPLPTGDDGIEGFYQINVRGIDALDNVTPQSRQRLWRGEIDTKPPSVSFPIVVDGSGAISSTTYRCIATDLNLDLDSSCIASGDIPAFRNSDLTLTTYDQVDDWYATTITNTSRLYSIDAARVYSGTAQSGQAMRACDLYGRCATAPETDDPIAIQPVGGEILLPGANSVLTSTETVRVMGDVYAETGLRILVIQVNDRPVFINHWPTDETTAEAWSFEWAPPGEGVYRFVPYIDAWDGELPAANTATRENLDNKAMAAEVADLPPVAYLPLITGGRAPTVLYLPMVENLIDVTHSYTGTAAILYVDLAPPAVGLEKTQWTQADALGDSVIELTGAVTDSLAVYSVEVRIDDGPWHFAGVDDSGRWRWPWRFAAPPDSESYRVGVRATDLAGQTAVISEQVTVDLIEPTPAGVTYAYVNSAGETLPMQPGDRLTDAVTFILSWSEATDAGGQVDILAGFTESALFADGKLSEYTGPGSHSQPVAPDEGWYATVRTIDPAGNVGESSVGPFFIVASD